MTRAEVVTGFIEAEEFVIVAIPELAAAMANRLIGYDHALA